MIIGKLVRYRLEKNEKVLKISVKCRKKLGKSIICIMTTLNTLKVFPVVNLPKVFI